MSVVKIKDPSATSTTGNTSYWLAGFNPIIFQYQRRDATFVSVTDVDGFARFNMSYIDVAPGINPFEGDTIYIQGEYYQTTTEILSIVPITVMGHPSVGLLTNVPFTANDNGFVNDISEKKNWCLEVTVQRIVNESYIELATVNCRAMPNGVVFVEVQEFLKSYFDNSFNYIPTGLSFNDSGNLVGFSIKHRQKYVGYESEDFYQEENYNAVNAALPAVGSASFNMVSYVVYNANNTAKFLSCFVEPTLWIGYPFSLSFIANEGTVGITLLERWFDVNKIQYDLATQGSIISADDQIIRLGSQRGMVSSYDFSYTALQLRTSYFPYAAISEEKMIRVKKPCSANNEIMLVWKNQLGGWEYYLFQSTVVKELTTSRPNWLTTSNNGILLKKSLTNSYSEVTKLVAAGIDLNDVNGLESLIKSVAVYVVNPQPPYNATRVYLDTGTWQVLNTKTALYDIEFTITKPEQFIQHD